MSEKKPSILTQAEQAVGTEDGLSAGVIVKDGTVGAELKARKDIGKKGGWVLGAVARTNDRFAALVATWKPKD